MMLVDVSGVVVVSNVVCILVVDVVTPLGYFVDVLVLVVSVLSPV